MTATLIIPGFNGSDQGHWQRFWLQDHPDSVLVEQEDWGAPLVDRWAARLELALLQHGEAFIVAHSLGCLLAAKFADRPSARRIKGHCSSLPAICAQPKSGIPVPFVLDRCQPTGSPFRVSPSVASTTTTWNSTG